ncbi:2-oxo-hepta-3-ene-1,7-dioic acid hydratase [Rhodococcus erythropolis]|uniref:2-oxo-hept-4-ene-1,7-dioate hydratase n=1 Tax=Rhodococcus erythropolis TaxID=1833 RepID=UPI000767517D|nr:2-oxo-hepta-3-ene-1,7-dioic acid hydratase [Rhodococcus erythropolis]MBO8146196.1 2-oxo-hepta-3-ene-1,7-dioic acid hydratase [Rhodococcus erythropolis]MDO1490316.1 2-oxo-hepta-3-ene-1,7-dioic acid hydratase [Rhodococcus erythropolis]GCB54628.1 2-oxo-hepta-3-ene-1,7-dioic acid hydratase [Rhodococcus erythropolis]
MLTERQIRTAAEELDQAELSGVQVGQLSLGYPKMDLDDAYAIQTAWVARKLARGRTIIGHKIGLTSKVMQRASNITEPDHGVLLDDMLFADGSEIPNGRFIVPRVEVELAFVLDRDLSGPGVTLYDVLDATRYVVPAVEIIDARIVQVDPGSGRTRTVFDTISDNAANAGIILGGRPVVPNETDLRWVSALCYRNAVVVESGVAAAVLNHPAIGVAWLANKLGRLGVGLKAGHVILAGSFTRPIQAQPGDTFHIDYGSLGTVSCRFAETGQGEQ